MKHQYLRKLAILPALALGIGLLLFVKSKKAEPVRRPAEERVVQVNTIKAPLVSIIPKAFGYGTVEPERSWQAVPEVSGRIISVHPRFAAGSLIEAGEELLRIDAEPYQLALEQLGAELATVGAQLSELQAQEQNFSELLNIEEESLALTENELTRFKELHAQKAISQNDLDRQVRTALTQRNVIQQLRNSVNLIPAQRNRLKSQIESIESKMSTAQLDLNRTVIKVPFTCRLSQINAETGEFVTKGQVVARADGVDFAEINAQFSVEKFLRLLPSGADEAAPLALKRLGESDDFKLSAEVRLTVEGREFTWSGEVDRLGADVDARTRTLGVLVRVDDPYAAGNESDRPPLVKGMYCEVILTGPVHEPLVVIPRLALHAESVYVIGADSRLEIRPIQIAFQQEEFVGVRSGISEGEQVVISDIVPAIEGMKLAGEDNPAMYESLRRSAGGES